MEDDTQQDMPQGGRAPDPEDVFFADRLQATLRRMDAPDGFTDRVMARVASANSTAAMPVRGRLLRFPQRFTTPVWRAAYAAAALLAVTVGTLHLEHERAEHRKADAAAAQFEQAMQVTGHALDQVSAQLERTEFGTVAKALQEDGGRK